MKTRLITILFFFIISLVLPIPVVMGHAPLGTGDNESIDKATLIPDPTKSWALFSALNQDGDPQYYMFKIASGQKIHVMLSKSMRPEDSGFTPRLVFIGPSIASQGVTPNAITVPAGFNARLVDSHQPASTYEPFSPSSFYSLSEETIDSPTPGTYYLVVYEQAISPQGGHYGLAIGDRETYTLDEWILIPFNLMAIYQWEGQSLALVLAPMLATMFVGVLLLIWKLRKQAKMTNIMSWAGGLAGILFVGTGATTLFQMLSALRGNTLEPAVAITLIFALVPVLIGALTIRQSIRDTKPSIKKRIYFVIMGVAALFMWVGLLIGPSLSILAGLNPTRMERK
ncbi:MAG: hypothetical protein V1850_04185 [Candidatus Bathyarchaeota archaeon]